MGRSWMFRALDTRFPHTSSHSSNTIISEIKHKKIGQVATKLPTERKSDYSEVGSKHKKRYKNKEHQFKLVSLYTAGYFRL